MKRTPFIIGCAAALAAAACSDATAPGNADSPDRTEVLSVLDASGWFADDFGVTGATQDATLSVTAGFDLGLAPSAADSVPLVQAWGRRRGTPIERRVTVDVVNDTARVRAVVQFDGTFLLDRTDDGVRNPTAKPLQEEAVQHALLVRGEPDASGHRWQLAALSPRQWRMTDEAKRTVHITRVGIWVNGTLALVVEDPTELFDVNDRVPRLHVGDVVRVAAMVDNTTGTGNEPATFVFLHVYHAGPTALGWARAPMRETEAGVFVREWTVRVIGRERITVDAIDSQTFNSDSEDDYRANVWAIPYRIE
jgi:hypothetical protein